MAGVSEPTASRSLRDDPQISQRTRALVSLVAEQVGYVPNAAARNLARRRSQTLGLMVPDVTDPVHGQIVSGFEQEATRRGYVLLVSSFRYDGDLEDRGLRALVSNQAAGIAVFGGVVEPDLVRVRHRGANLVFIGPEYLGGLRDARATGTIQADDDAGMRAAVRGALALGYTKVAFLNGPHVASNVRRRTAVAVALDLAGAERPRNYDLREGGLTRIAERIVHDGRDLVICFDDQRALRLLSTFNALGVQVPGEVGVIGFDDIPFASISNPPLSTVVVPYEEMGQIACRILLEQLRSGAPAPSITLDVEVVLRGTTAPQ
jgi:LacI family transcriptional regulator